MKNNNITKIILFLTLAIFLFGSGLKIGEYKSKLNTLQRTDNNSLVNLLKSQKPLKKESLDFSLFWEAWEKVENKFIDKKKIDPQKMFYGAIKGMVSSLEDPYTFFLTPDENNETKKDLGGKFEGIGAQLGLKYNRIVIIAPLKKSPAEKAGVKAGDFINKVDDKSTKGWTLPQAVSKIRGPKGSKVKMSLQRNSKEFEVEIIRDEIKIDSIELNLETKNNFQFSYIKINQFGDNTNDEWDKVVDKVVNLWRNKTIKGIILDIRDNPGGYLESSVYIASDFLPFDAVVVKQESATKEDRVYKVTRDGKLQGIPLVVIINKGSASASEILAGTLRDHKKAKLAGEKSFGKGSVQEALDLKDGAGLHVTVAKWILPNGDWINGKGIEPEIKVENKLNEGQSLTRENDKQLDQAIELLLK